MSELKNKAYYEALKVKAAVCYIKDGLSSKEISRQLKISLRSLKKWKDAGKWLDFRKDLEVLNEYKAANLYIEKGLYKSEIAMKLSLPETKIDFWIYTNGWDAARQLKQAHNDYTEIISGFCSYYAAVFPKEAIAIQAAKDAYLKKALKKKIRPPLNDSSP